MVQHTDFARAQVRDRHHQLTAHAGRRRVRGGVASALLRRWERRQA